MPRAFVTSEITSKTDSLVLDSAASHHLAHVLRLGPGDQVTLFDGSGWEYQVRITEGTPRALRVQLLEKQPSLSNPQYSLTLAVALLKGPKMEWIVQKAVELGVSALWLYVSQRTIPRPAKESPNRGKMNRYRRILTEATRQSGRSDTMKLEMVASFEALLEQTKTLPLRVLCWEQEQALTIRSWLDSVKERHSGHLPPTLALVGPEGGFTGEEVRQAREKGFEIVSLGRRVLRSETAALALATLLLHAGGEI